MNRAANKTVLITGAASGMGRAHCLLLASEGARIIATDRDIQGGKETLSQIEVSGGVGVFIQHDIASEADWKRVISGGCELGGRVGVRAGAGSLQQNGIMHFRAICARRCRPARRYHSPPAQSPRAMFCCDI